MFKWFKISLIFLWTTHWKIAIFFILGQLPDFETRWKNFIGGNKHVPALDMLPKANNPQLNPPPGDPSYLSLFKKFFGI